MINLFLMSKAEATMTKKNSLRKFVFKTKLRGRGKHTAMSHHDMSQEGSKVLF